MLVQNTSGGVCRVTLREVSFCACGAEACRWQIRQSAAPPPCLPFPHPAMKPWGPLYRSRPIPPHLTSTTIPWFTNPIREDLPWIPCYPNPPRIHPTPLGNERGCNSSTHGIKKYLGCLATTHTNNIHLFLEEIKSTEQLFLGPLVKSLDLGLWCVVNIKASTQTP